MSDAQPITPAQSSRPPEARPWQPWRSLIAVALGVLANLGGTNIVTACLILILFGGLAAGTQGQTAPDLMQQFQAELQGNLAYQIPAGCLGLLFALLGGLVAGKIAGRAEVWHGLAVGLGVILVSTTCTLALRLPLPNLGQLLLGSLLALVNLGSATLGGVLAQWHTARRRKVRL